MLKSRLKPSMAASIPILAPRIKDRLYSWSADRTLRLWDLESGFELICYELPADITAANHDDNLIAIGLSVGEIHLLARDDEAPPPLRGHSEPVTGLSFLPDASLVSCAEDGTLRAWRPQTTDSIEKAQGVAPFLHLATSPEQRNVVLTDARDNLWSFDCSWLFRPEAVNSDL